MQHLYTHHFAVDNAVKALAQKAIYILYSMCLRLTFFPFFFYNNQKYSFYWSSLVYHFGSINIFTVCAGIFLNMVHIITSHMNVMR